VRATLSFAVSLREEGEVLGWRHLTNLAQTAEFQLRRRVSSLNFRESLLLRARITKINPGSQAARYWGGLSAGAAIVEITEDVDERTNAVLITFRQERRSSWGLLGEEPAYASYENKLTGGTCGRDFLIFSCNWKSLRPVIIIASLVLEFR